MTSTTVIAASATPQTVNTPTVRKAQRRVPARPQRMLQLALPLRADEQQPDRNARVAAAEQQ